MNAWNIKQLPMVLLLVLSLVFAAGCGQQAAAPSSSSDSASSTSSSSSLSASSSSSSSSSSASKSSQPESLTIKVYFPNADGTKLIANSRKVKTDSKNDKYAAAMESLLAGTTEKGNTNIFPKKAQLQTVKVADGVASLSESKELQKDFVGGSTGEEMLVGSIVNTLTEFPEVKKVRILIDGKSVESLSGHMDLTEPLTRMKNLL